MQFTFSVLTVHMLYTCEPSCRNRLHRFIMLWSGKYDDYKVKSVFRRLSLFELPFVFCLLLNSDRIFSTGEFWWENIPPEFSSKLNTNRTRTDDGRLYFNLTSLECFRKMISLFCYVLCRSGYGWMEFSIQFCWPWVSCSRKLGRKYCRDAQSLPFAESTERGTWASSCISVQYWW